ncbi:MAG: ABC transporter permease subunit [Pseudomonadota bacterium]
MIWIIFKKEIKDNLRSFRFLAGLCLALFISIIITFILIKNYEIELKAYNEVYQEELLKQARAVTYNHVKPFVMKAPEKLGILAKGIDSRIGFYSKLTLDLIPYDMKRTGNDNELLELLTNIDLASIFKIIITLLALLFAFDCFSKDNRNLKLICSNKVSMQALVLGKYLAIILSVYLILFISFIIVSMIFYFHPKLNFDSSEWLRFIFSFVIFQIYLSLFILMAINISIISKRSANSMVLVLFFWIFLSFILNSAVNMFISNIYKVPDFEEVEGSIIELDMELSDKLEVLSGEHDKYFTSRYNEVVLNAKKEAMEKFKEYYHDLEKLRMKYALKKAKITADFFNKFLLLLEKINEYSFFSPSYLLDNSLSLLSGTNYRNFFAYMEKVKAYRNEYIKYLDDKKILKSYLYFTPLKEKNFPLDDDDFYYGMKHTEKVYLDTYDNLYKYYQTIDTLDIPKFEFIYTKVKDQNLIISLNAMILILMNLFLYFLAVLLLKKADLR